MTPKRSQGWGPGTWTVAIFIGIVIVNILLTSSGYHDTGYQCDEGYKVEYYSVGHEVGYQCVRD